MFSQPSQSNSKFKTLIHSNIIEMRTSLKKPKPKPSTLLQEESTKLKQKLDLLRQQVTQKKQQKQMNKTATSLQSPKPLTQNLHNKLLSQTTKVNMSKFPDTKLKNLLLEAKLDSLQDKLKEKGVKSYERFIEMSDEQIDEWKDVAVGWRIKLKKLLKITKENKDSTENPDLTCKKPQSQQPVTVNQQPSFPQQVKQKNIEQIIKQRKQVQIFVPMCRQIQELNEQEYYQQTQMTEEDQDVIIKSFMKVFQPRKGIISKESRIGESSGKSRWPSQDKEKKVSWSKKVQQLEKQSLQKNRKKYPKESIAKEMFKLNQSNVASSESLPQSNTSTSIQYCWACFRKINIEENIGFRVSEQSQVQSPRYFCREKCQVAYEDELAVFEEQLEEKGKAEGPLGRENEGAYFGEEDDLQTIDLAIL